MSTAPRITVEELCERYENETVHTEHVTALGADVQSRVELLTQGMVARGMSPHNAHEAALSLVDRAVGGQASVLAFSKIYLLSGLVLMCAIPLMFFWRHGKGRAAVQAH